MNSLNENEKNFYQRHLMLDGFGFEAQEKLKAASVLVVGAGGLGCPVLQYLASVGFGRIGIIDNDLVEVSNLQRQFLYLIEDVGAPKAIVAAKRLEKHNPNILLEPNCNRLNHKNILEIFNQYDVIVDGSDNFDTRYLVNDACVILGKPLVFGAIYKFSGQLSVFNFNNGPTYRCLFPKPPKVGGLPSCAEVGVLGVLPGVIGSMQALETIKIISGIGEVLSGRVLLFDALGQKFNEIILSPVSKNKEINELKVTENEPICDLPMQSRSFEIMELNPSELVDMYIGNPKLSIIDVRESWEREIECIRPSKHIPLGNFYEDSITEILPDSRSEEVVIYCKAGVRSMDACKVLQKLGFEKIYNLNGGMMHWCSENMPLVME